MSLPPALNCFFKENETSWTCGRCGLDIPKSQHPDRPFVACRVGMKQMGLAYSPIALAKKIHESPVAPQPSRDGLPGTELKAMLGKIGIVATEGCTCNMKAAIMDSWGCSLCEERLDSHIVPWLREEARRRKLPFIDMAARMLVKRAIAKARRKIVAETKPS